MANKQLKGSESPEKFFKRMTRIFKSGVQVKRKIRAQDTAVVVADKTKSSGTLLFQKSFSPTYASITSNAYNIAERQVRYQDFQQMEQTAEIAAALDLWADESSSPDEHGRALHIFSDNEKIKQVLDDLFYNRLNIEFNLRSWVRSCCKFGDFFLLNDVHPTEGVVHAYPIPVNEIEREEGYDRDDPMAVRFRWVSLGNRILQNWEVSHFRLLGNDSFLPYGCSVIEAARRVWRQLILIEDAMLVYRVTRAPERRVFYIDVGNLPANDIPAYVEAQKQALRMNQVLDSQTSRVDLRYNPLPVHKDTPIPLLDGTTLTIENLSNKMKENSNWTPWVYSIQDKSLRIVPGKVTWCDRNYVAKKLVKVWLDNDSYVLTAPEHPFVLRDGSSKRADELVVGQALMPFYRELSVFKEKVDGTDDLDGYEKIYDPKTQRFVYTHRRVAEILSQPITLPEGNNNWVTHHVDFNRLNNDPSNLLRMGNVDHWYLHASEITRYNKSDLKKERTSKNNIERNSVGAMSWYNGSDLHKSHNENRKIGQLKDWGDQEKKTQRKLNMQWKIPNEMIEKISDLIRKDPKISRVKIHEEIKNDQELMNALMSIQTPARDVSKFSYQGWMCEFQRRGQGNGFTQIREAVLNYKNHKVSKIEFLDVDGEDVYCMTVVGSAGEDDRHNFMVLGLNEDGSQSDSGVSLWNSVDEDYFIPIRGSDTGTKIDTLAAGQNTGTVEDVAYIQKKLFAALKIPKAYLGYEEGLSSKSTLAQMDIRFSRSVSVIQRTFIAELNKLAIIHLFTLGFQNEDLANFTLHLSNPSTVAEQQKLELWRTRFEIGGSLPEGMGTKQFVYKTIWGLNDDEIDQINNDRVKETLVDATIAAMAEGGEASGPGGGGGGGGGAPAGGGFDLDAGGEDEDIFSDDDAGGSADDSGGEDEIPDEENAGPEPLEDEDPDLELLTSSDDQDDPETFKIPSMRDSPVKVAKQLQKSLYNRSRHRTHGPSKTHMPDFLGMVNNKRREDTMNDPYDTNAMKALITNPFGESIRRPNAILTNDIMSALNNMKREHDSDRVAKGGTLLLNEGDEGVEIELDDSTSDDDELSLQEQVFHNEREEE